MRADLSHSQRAVQACHAIANLTNEATRRKDQRFKRWVEEERTLVLLRAENEQELLRIHEAVDKAGIIHNVAEEPDWATGPQQTALAIYPHDPEQLKPIIGSLRLL